MKSKIVIIILFIQFFSLKISSSQSIHLNVMQKEGYYLELHQFKCKFIRNETKFYIYKSDTTINLEDNVNYVNIVIWDKLKEFYYYIPLYIDSGSVSIELIVNDSLKNDIDKFKNFNIYGSINSINYSNFFRAQKILSIKNKNINIEDVKEYFIKNPENIYALYLLCSSDKYGKIYMNYLDSTNDECKGKKYFLKSFQQLDSLQEYSKTYLNFNNFTNDLSKFSKKVVPSSKNSKISFKKEGNIYFWASWCKPCLAELLLLSKEEKANENNFFISLDKDSKKCLNAAKKVGLTNNIFKTDQEWLKKYQIDLIPTIIYYNNQMQTLKKIR